MPAIFPLPLNSTICGLDEVGRGALAGPLVAAAVIVSREQERTINKAGLHVRDSKILTAGQREKIALYADHIGIRHSIETISARIINNHGIGKANRVIFTNLIRRMDADLYIVDGNLRWGSVRPGHKVIRSVPKADTNILPVMLAGIIAKVFRDRLMAGLHDRYPDYGWDRNAGYGTKIHIERLRTHGMCPQHRLVYVATALS
jgi:ribonuclease HII